MQDRCIKLSPRLSPLWVVGVTFGSLLRQGWGLIAWAVLILSTVTMVGEARAQTNEMSARQILRAAADAVRQLRSAHYEATYESVPASPAASVRIVTGAVKIERTGSGWEDLQGKLWMRRKGKQGDWETAFDGTLARFLDHAGKVLMEASIEEDGSKTIVKSSPPVLVFLKDLLHVEPFQIEREAQDMEYMGVEEVGGMPCHVIRVQYDREKLGNDLTEGTWWFGIEDYLPRKYVRVLETSEGRATRGMTLSSLRVNEPVDPDDFFLELPAGYSIAPVPGTRAELLAIGDAAPDWRLFDTSGHEHTLSDYAGRVVVMCFWATWCGWCRLGLPHLQQLHEDFEENDVTVLGINYRESEGVDVVGFTADNGYTFTVLLAGESLEEAYGVASVPTYYVIDAEGKVIYNHTGYGPESDAALRIAIEQHLVE